MNYEYIIPAYCRSSAAPAIYQLMNDINVISRNNI